MCAHALLAVARPASAGGDPPAASTTQPAAWRDTGRPAARGLLKGRRLDPQAERVLLALTANRALAPSSKLAAARWAGEDVLITGLPETTDDACYWAMDWLLEIRGALEKEAFDRVADLPGLETDLLFFDTTSTYFVTEDADAPVPRDERSGAVPSGNTEGGSCGRRGSGPGASPRTTVTTCPSRTFR